VYRQRNFAFGQQLLTLRTRAHLTQIALAEELGVNRRSVLKWETGESYPKAETLQRLIAIFLSRHAFTEGQERAEAQALWSQAAQDAPRPLASFDDAWFTHTLVSIIASPAASAEPTDHRLAHAIGSPPALAAQPEMPRTIIDWGEAVAVPRLYGRDSELGTLQRWVVDERCRAVTILGLGGLGKSSLAIALAHQVLAQFDMVLFRSLQNGPPLADVLDQTIRAISRQQATLPDLLPDKIALLIQLFRQRRCLLILDNFESIMQPSVLTGTYRTGYDEYGALLRGLSEREHQSCLLLTSREKPAELGPPEGRTAPVRTLQLSGLDDHASRAILEAKDIVATTADVGALAHLYGGNPLALNLVAEPIRELFGGDVGAFLATGEAFLLGVGKLLEQQLARATPLEQAILYWLAIGRESVSLNALLATLGSVVPQHEVLIALESLRRRTLIERAPDRSAFTLQPVILEYMTDHLVAAIHQEIVDGQSRLLHRHALIQATAREYIRRSQEHMIATPLLERLVGASGGADAVETKLLTLLSSWRDQPLIEQNYGPGNVINLLRLLRGNLRGLDLWHLAIRQAYLQSVEMQDSSLAGALIQDSVFTATIGAITAVAISSTGEYWAASSRRGELRLWAAGGRTLHRMWRAHADMVRTLTFSPDGRTLASGSWDGAVKLWDVASGALRWSGRHTSQVESVAFVPDGSMLASGGNDATVRLWDRRSGTQLQTLPHPGPISGISWGPDGHLLATGDREGGIRLWEVQQSGPGISVQELAGHTTWVDSLAFAPDGSMLASASWDGTVKLWDISTALSAGVASGRLRQTLAKHMDRVNYVTWSPDGRTLASCSRDQTIRLWDVESSSYRAVLQGHTASVDGLAFTPDGRSLLSGSEDGTLRVWEVPNGQCTRVVQGYLVTLNDIDWSRDGTQLVSGGTATLVTIFDVTGGTQPRVLRGHSGVVFGVGWSPDGRTLASSEWDNIIRLWDSTSGECLRVLQHPDDTGNYFYGLTWSPDGQRLASGTYRHGMQVFDMTAQRPRWPGHQFPTWIRHVAWSPDGAQVAGGGDDGIVYVWDAADGALLQRLVGHHGMVTCVAWSPDGTRLASGGNGSEGGELFVCDPGRGERMHTVAEHPGIVNAVAWGPSDELLVSGGGDGALRWWDAWRGECVRVRQAHQGTVQSLRRSPDGTKLASCGDDGAIMLWDLNNGEYLQTLRPDRPYERLNITGIRGLAEAQHAALVALGAVEG
jgi:WD40 repeat protein/transcriptional regulator with XRE-family HTH domain